MNTPTMLDVAHSLENTTPRCKPVASSGPQLKKTVICLNSRGKTDCVLECGRDSPSFHLPLLL